MLNISKSVGFRTPLLEAVDPLAAVVRQVRYRVVDECSSIKTLVQRSKREVADRTILEWDARLTSVPVTRCDFNVSKCPVRMISADAGPALYLADASGHIRRVWMARDQALHFQYDSCGRFVEQQSFVDGEWRTAEFWEIGSGDHSFRWRGRVRAGRSAMGEWKAEEYGLHGSVIAQKETFFEEVRPSSVRGALLEGNAYLTFVRANALGQNQATFDAVGSVSLLQHDVSGNIGHARIRPGSDDSLAAVIDGIRYDATSRMIGMHAGALHYSSCFDEATGRMASAVLFNASEVVLQRNSYEYDPVGCVLRSTSIAGKYVDEVACRYDSLYQLVQISGIESFHGDPFQCDLPAQAWGDQAYVQRIEYDAAFNPIFIEHSTGVVVNRRDFNVAHDSNRSIIDGDSRTTFDAFGNPSAGGAAISLSWDEQKRLVAIETEEGKSHVRCHDSIGRLRRNVCTYGERHEDLRWLPVLELMGSAGAMSYLNVGCLSACISRDNTGGNVVTYAFKDRRESTIAEFNSDGNRVGSAGYYAFGGVAWWVAHDGLASTYRMLRHGGMPQVVPGFIEYPRRTCCPSMGRWLSPDPAGDIDGTNRYRFIQNNPLSLIDLTGESPVIPSIEFRPEVSRPLENDHPKYSPEATLARVQKNLKGHERSNFKALQQWQKIPENLLHVHAFASWRAGNDSPLLSRPAQDVFAEWDVISTSVVDEDERKRYGIERHRRPRPRLQAELARQFPDIKSREYVDREAPMNAFSEVMFRIEAPSANIIGTHERDLHFPNHAGMVQLADGSDRGKRLLKDPAALSESIRRGVSLPSAEKDPRYVKKETFLEVLSPQGLMKATERARKDSRWPIMKKWQNEVLVVGRPGVAVHPGMPNSGTIQVKEIIVMPQGNMGWLEETTKSGSVRWKPVWTVNSIAHAELRSTISRLQQANPGLPVRYVP